MSHPKQWNKKLQATKKLSQHRAKKWVPSYRQKTKEGSLIAEEFRHLKNRKKWTFGMYEYKRPSNHKNVLEFPTVLIDYKTISHRTEHNDIQLSNQIIFNIRWHECHRTPPGLSRQTRIHNAIIRYSSNKNNIPVKQRSCYWLLKSIKIKFWYTMYGTLLISV